MFAVGSLVICSFVFYLLTAAGCISASAPSSDPWASCLSLSGEELKSALNDAIDNQRVLSYEEVWSALKLTDEDPDNLQNVRLIYTQKSLSKDMTQNGLHANDPDAWNREHLWPKSHGFPKEGSPAYTDLHHLRPADASVNSSRGIKDFDESDETHHEAALCSADRDSWEPPETVKGDIARALFYMAVRYEGEHGEVNLELTNDPAFSVPGQPSIGVLDTLLEWNRKDPPDQRERARNDIVEGFQGNRNPFVDHPEFVDRIWLGL